MKFFYKIALSKKAKQILKVVSVFGVALIVAIIFHCVAYFNLPNKLLAENKFILVEKGDTLIKISKVLAKEQIITYQKIFLYGSRILKGRHLIIKSGEYSFERNIKPKEVLQKLIDGNFYYRKLTLSEGLSTHSILEIVDTAEGLTGELPKDIKEGTLLPETYLYTRGETKTEIVERMQNAMTETLDKLWETRDLDIPTKTKQEALTLASIVEKETGIPEERGIVASVFINRLKTKMRLQSDPTVVYVFAQGNIDLEREIRQSDLQRKSPFNTYQIYGLPPAPICNPGVDSLKAVLNPPKTDYLFFVATGNGGHNFSTNIRDHINHVNKYRKVVKEYRLKNLSEQALQKNN